MLQLFGHLHPVLVHLPIGILLLACLFMWQSRKDKYENLQPVINTILFWGMISAFVSCISGYMLSQSGEYDDTLVSWHQWMGISVAVISALTYYIHKKPALAKWQWLLGTLLLFLIFITGHLGGSLTHGSDYLTQPLENLFEDDTIAIVKRRPIADIQQAIVYTDVIQPVLQSKCYSCHGPARQKGKLRMDQPDLLMKGGKDGAVIIPGKASASEMIKRISSGREEEHHMAPKEKPQLTEQEVSLIRWWVDNGADFTKKVKDFQQPEKIKPLLNSLQAGNEEKKQPPGIPPEPVEKADDAAIQKLKNLGVVVIPVAQKSNYLEVNFVTAPKVTDRDIDLLLPLKKQLVWLKLGNTGIGDTALADIGQCTNLTQLQLDHTNITDKGLERLQSLSRLQSLNLAGTKVTAQGIEILKDLKELKSLYLYQTNVNRNNWEELKKIFPKVAIDSGGYVVPALETDTMIVKPPKIK
jgi:uncharacterized membrane protein